MLAFPVLVELWLSHADSRTLPDRTGSNFRFRIPATCHSDDEWALDLALLESNQQPGPAALSTSFWESLSKKKKMSPKRLSFS
jgi:hypothetical protein